MSQHFKLINREIISIFGFVRDQVANWIDLTSTATPKIPYGVTNAESKLLFTATVRGFVNTLHLKSPNVLKTAQNYYACSTITGMQLENQEDFNPPSAQLHWERSILFNEALTASLLEGNSVFSIFTGALLKDMGYFSDVNFNFLDEISFGKNKSCDFFQNVCHVLTYPEFSPIATTSKCDFYGQGFGSNTPDQYIDPGCFVPQLTKTKLCTQTSYTNTITRQIGGQSSKCFNSYAYPTVGSPPSPESGLRCHEISCTPDFSSIQVRLLSTQSPITVCSTGNAGLQVNLASITSALTVKTSGLLTCPSDYKAFCSSPSKCLNDCSMNGYCVRQLFETFHNIGCSNSNPSLQQQNYCVCNSGYTQSDCSQVCPLTTPFLFGSTCVAICPVLTPTFANPNNTCLAVCPDGYYGDTVNRVCKKCHSSCSQCTNSLQTTCSSCNYPYQFNIGLSSCEIICDLSCATCFGTAQSQCYSCINGYYLDGFECKICVAPCSSCTTSTLCSSCIANYTYIPGSHTCTPVCDSSCVTCSLPMDPNSCKTCLSPPNFLNILNVLNQLGQCLPCSSNCLTCSAMSTSCTTCAANYFVFNNVCYPICDSSCLTCFLPNSSSCLSCLDGKYLTASNTCVACPPTCQKCSSPTVCTSCEAGKLLGSPPDCSTSTLCVTSNCLTCDPIYDMLCITCSDGYYLKNNECLVCDPGCFQCSNQPYNCTSCKQTYTMTAGNICIMTCHPTCKTCLVPLLKDKCQTCYNGQTLIVNATLTVQQCLPCTPPCLTCSGTQTSCMTCIANYNLSTNVCLPNCDPSCNLCSLPNNPQSCTACNPGYSLIGNQCLNCSPLCKTCLNGSITSCSSCYTNYSLLGTQCIPNCHSSCNLCDVPLSNTNCISCFNGYYLTNLKECLPCDTTVAFCKNCASLANYCLSCQPNYSLTIGGICVPTCIAHCATCSAPFSASACLTPEDGYFLQLPTIQQCVSPCGRCSSTSVCLDCINSIDYSFSSPNCNLVCHSSCLTCSLPNNPNACITCPTTSFQPINTQTCVPCMLGCSACTGYAQNCSGCLAGYTFNVGQCLYSCHSTCLTCTGPAATQCASCVNGKYLDGLHQCQPCNSPCLFCSSALTCLSCIPVVPPIPVGYSLSGGTCNMICAPNCLSCSLPLNPDKCVSCVGGYYFKSSIVAGITYNNCLPCLSNCKLCVTLPTQCTGCFQYYKIFGTTCINDCGANPNCDTCTDPTIPGNTCTSCLPGYLLQVTPTTTGNLLPITTCIPCIFPCSACSGLTTVCTNCAVGYSLNGNTCLPNCHSTCSSCSLPANVNACTTCIAGKYLTSTNSCANCNSSTSFCQECSLTASNCLSCVTNYSIYPLIPPSGSDVNICKPDCDPSCSTCSLPLSSTACSSCNNGFFLIIVSASNKYCAPCLPECMTCSAATTCDSCNPGFQFAIPANPGPQVCVPSSCHLSCLTCSASFSSTSCLSCYSNSWYNSVSKTCTPCSFPCLSCITSSTTCLTCAINYTLNLITHTCTPDCNSTCLSCSLPLIPTACSSCHPQNALTSTFSCVPCMLGCSTCIGTASICTVCSIGYHLIPLTTTTKTCTLTCVKGCNTCSISPSNCQTCMVGYVFNSSTNSCALICDPACIVCFFSYSASSCSVCATSYYLSGTQCTLCPRGTYSNGAQCLSCIDNCLDCTTSTNCQKPRAGYILDPATNLYIRNPKETYIIKSDCNYSCKTCIDRYSSCVTCAANRIMDSSQHSFVNECTCPAGFSDVGVSTCEYSSSQSVLLNSNTATFASSLSLSLLLGILTFSIQINQYVSEQIRGSDKQSRHFFVAR